MEVSDIQADDHIHAPHDEARRWNQEVRVFVVCGFAIIGSLITIAGILVLLGRDSGELTTVGGPGREEPAQPDSNKVGEDLVTPISEASTVTPTMSPRLKTPPTFATFPPAEVARAVPIPNDFLVCTVNGEGPSLAGMRPPATQCNLIFFDSKYKEMRVENKETFNENEQAFLNWPNFYPYGQFELLTSNFPSTIRDLYQKTIRHTAVINIYRDSVTENGFAVALRALRIAYEVLSQYNSTKTSYFVLGAAIDDPANYRLVRLISAYFVPSLFIAIAHGSYDDRELQDCRILPPTWLSIPAGFRPENITYGRSLAESCNLLSEVARAGIQVPTAISFTLSGHMYKPRFRDPDAPINEEYELFRPCENFDGEYYVSPAELCSPNTEMYDRFQKSNESDVLFTFDTAEEQTLTFDNWETMRHKVCETRNTCQGVTFGVAVYDIEYDAPRPECLRFGHVGPFGGVAFFANMARYFKSLTPANPFTRSGCLSVTA